MFDSKFIIFLVLILLTPWAVLWIINSATGKSVKKIFRKLEDKYSFKTDYSKKVGFKNLPSAWGIYRNRNVKIESILADTPDGKKVLPHTQLTVDCPDSNGFNFLIAKRTRKNNAAFISGSSLTDDNEFDNKFIVQTSDLAKFRKVLDFNSKFKFEQAYSLGFDGLLKLENNTFRYIEKGLLRDEHDLLRLELILHEICDIADSLKYS